MDVSDLPGLRTRGRVRRTCQILIAQFPEDLVPVQPGKSNQNAFIERFNHAFREELLDPIL
ncbi:MAG: transposase [Gemmatimonadota bacterium]|nr:transposase [Gemmatimonadota bacterium]